MKFGRNDYDQRIIDTQDKIPNDEPVFLLRGSDPYAPELLLTWAMKLRLNGGNPLMAESAERHAQDMIKWQKVHGVRTPDMKSMSEDTRELILELNEILSNLKQSDVQRLQELCSLISGSDNSLGIIIPMDLLNPLEEPSVENLKTDSRRDLKRMDVVIFISKDKCKVLKNRFEI